MVKPLIADIKICINVAEHEEFLLWFSKLNQKQKIVAKQNGRNVEKQYLILKNVVIPSNNIDEINLNCLSRIKKYFDIKSKEIKVEEIIKSRVINGY